MRLYRALLVLILFSQPCYAQHSIENFLGMRFVSIPAGDFDMGTQDLDAAIMEMPNAKHDALRDEIPAHRVTITKPYYLGQTEVTQWQWFRVMENKPGPDTGWNNKDWRSLPVVSVSWNMAKRFVEEISKMDTQFRYRLPSEAEWEYAARAGINDLRPVSIDKLEDHAWFIDNSGDMPHPVATRAQNKFGLYDMLGNVWEWVNDWYDPHSYTDQVRIDPAGPADGVSKARRGGSFHCPLHLTRPGYRSANPPDTQYEVVGFRIIAEEK